MIPYDYECIMVAAKLAERMRLTLMATEGGINNMGILLLHDNQMGRGLILLLVIIIIIMIII